ncbi:flagellar hook basal-body protein [Aestuariibacter sp. AA17]|uniref:Flagellar hook basal-body protein n=1 Tax=Fluctibacter corallii TaxID=2984329 RepID=A0ABT3AAK3_9ALTE|nr:flagellar hook basal-body protein [Aestuariibacter sp. AA17]MCV2885322.1 flagellar hook basal-body protein [Aestuariibacter sp. AA17]
MIDALYIAESGLTVKQKQLDSIANNIANVSTPGFKANHVNFMTVVQENRDANGDMIGTQALGVAVGESALDLSAGKMQQTGRALDVAISGDGFIEVDLTNGEKAYSRGGRLSVDNDGFLQTDSGHRLSASIQIPPDVKRLEIGRNGAVSATLDSGEAIQLGDIQLVKFSNTNDLHLLSDNVFAAGDSAAQSAFYSEAGENGLGSIEQGMLEASNVSLNQEMMNMMLAQRGYQLNARLIQVSDQVLETLNNLRR